MTNLTFVLLSGTLSFGVTLALAIRELFMLSKQLRDGDEPPPEECFPGPHRPLPSCLMPTPVLVRDPMHVRVLEDA